MARPEKVRLGEILVQQKLLSEEQLGLALAEQKRSGRKLGRVFIENGYVTEEQIAGALARQLNIPYLNLKFFNINPEIVRLLPETQARRFRALVLEDRRGTLLVGMSDPTDLFAYDEIARIVKQNIELAVVNETEVLGAIDRIYRRTEDISDLARELEQDLGDVSVDFGALAAAIRTWKRRRSSSCCNRCSTTPRRCGRPTSISNRRKAGCRSASASTACCTCRPRPISRSHHRWRCG
jgi:MSHA biogenesis protein MshE